MNYLKKLKFLSSPKLILASMIGGAIVGIYFKSLVPWLAPIGSLYMSLLGMCITPLLVVSISSSLAALLKNQSLKGQIGSIFSLFPVCMLLAAIAGSAFGILGQPGKNLSPEAQDAIGKLVVASSSELTQSAESAGLLSLFKLMIPSNIFSALSQGNNLAVLFFSILLGISIGLARHEKANHAVNLLEVLYEAFSKMITGIMFGLPIGLFCLFADHISHIGPGIMYAIWKYVALCLVGCVVLIGSSWIIIKYSLKVSWKDLWALIKEPSLVALATSSSMASIPAILNSFDEKTSLNKDSTHLFVPLSVCLNAIGSSFLISLTAIFMMDLYGYSIELSNLFIVLIGSIFAAVAMSGAPGIGALAMFGIVTSPLGIPLEPTMVIVMATLPITEGILTLSNIAANMAVVSTASKPSLPEANHTTEILDDSISWQPDLEVNLG